LIGGRLFKHSNIAVGAAAIEAIRQIRADTYFMDITGIHPEAGLTTRRSGRVPQQASAERGGRGNHGPGLRGIIERRLTLPHAPVTEATSIIDQLGITDARA
jgi:hypothetical protein